MGDGADFLGRGMKKLDDVGGRLELNDVHIVEDVQLDEEVLEQLDVTELVPATRALARRPVGRDGLCVKRADLAMEAAVDLRANAPEQRLGPCHNGNDLVAGVAELDNLHVEPGGVHGILRDQA